ncbi:taurine ABC transporter ATPase [Bacillus sp. SA1-12]|uniref:ABC transporter ATP-binding protein n=1 Tax=Bacillus sp. SA1-12 TaxID=1455638 RepID=UPI0006271AD6|nr:ABC transporter ATP-binding protein [Bacillus sp. SA1-12]KKI90503.1 taurine ABC transporter ATPase [Bacillus sp. SA1-12]
MNQVLEVQQPQDQMEHMHKKIEAKSVSFKYQNVEVLKDINLEVIESEFLVIMGPSGCGKSTFLRLMAGLEQPNQGDIIINGVSSTTKTPDCSVVFQDYSLFPWLSAEENIVLALKQKLKGKKTKKELQQIAEEYLLLVQLGHAVKKYPGQMSGGMKQRAAIARALAFGSDLLLMDEPFGALDAITRIHLQDLILRISRDQKRTIVFVTHDADEAIYLADRIVMFSLGSEGVTTTSVDVPFSKPRNRKKLFSSSEFTRFREHIFSIMNQGLLENIEEQIK